MPEFDLHVFCPECRYFHDVLLRVSLEEYFDVRNVREVYGDNVPPAFYAAIAEQRCPNTGIVIKQLNPEQMVLVAIAGHRPGSG